MNEIDAISIQQAPIKMMRKLNLKLCASRRIRDDHGLTMISITGKQQSGKSDYAMWILWEIYNHNIDEVLDHIIFTPDELDSRILHAINGNYRIPALLFDDASVSMSAAQYGSTPREVLRVAKIGDTLGIGCKALLLTSPSADLIKAFRNYQHYRVVIRNGRHQFDRIARGYSTGLNPDGKTKWIRTEWDDSFDIRVPFYNRYYEMRKALSLSTLNSSASIVEDTYIISTIKKFMKGRPEWRGTATNLMTIARLNGTPNKLMKELNANRVSLGDAGITFTQKMENKIKSKVLTINSKDVTFNNNDSNI